MSCDCDIMSSGECHYDADNEDADYNLAAGSAQSQLMATYSVEGVIGSGGFGTVYSATRKSDRRTVNIPFVHFIYY